MTLLELIPLIKIKNTKIIELTATDPGRQLKDGGPIAAEFQGPGPAALSLPSLFGNPNIKQSSKSRAPSYTFGSRNFMITILTIHMLNKFNHNTGTEEKTTSTTPAPNSYNTSRLSQRGKYHVEGKKQ
ncbi:unnamed protein product [Lepeophtheirus salmonis]|uniref:(salmon louse) hypothetical protein n=1 Tax=Lepeophtheirus salmonis TaxID=72036 RepID=A0A7R8HC69_LEPSM|nr:unnamed protein product [Lepeophtheirus salmonis]CAF2984310.1 unnamed protein product [Lepeophtheirus salmonis]